jgi:ABC-type transport system involved in cytochrome c biogenesis permease subunit
MEVMMHPELADQRPIFLVHHPELLSELKLEDTGVENQGLRYFTFQELLPVLPEIERQAARISGVESQARTAFERQVMKLQNAVVVYQRLKNSLCLEGTEDFANELARFRQLIRPGGASLGGEEGRQNRDQPAPTNLVNYLERYAQLSSMAYPLVVPPRLPEVPRDYWMNMGASLMESARTGEIHPATLAYAAMATAFRQNQPADFKRTLDEYAGWLGQRFMPELKKARGEHFYNTFMPFYRALVIYLFAFVLGCCSWFGAAGWLRRSAYHLVTLALVIHTIGLVFRMVLEGRPPVTNLYSSAIFIGWGAAVLGQILERFHGNGIGSVTAAAVGFTTQIIAHNLALGGDTMEMLRAVLDTNFWLATHVVTITLGYSSTFVAGFLALLYVVRGCFTRSLDSATAQALARMVYGIICFATLFSFAGTVLGGIWADQSWGRFWGWDPKENGALLIVLWNALILHARGGGLVKERGLMNLTLFGNVVTSWSWFGVNMLGIGLHSYGFMDSAFRWLVFFVASQLLVIGDGLLPARYWLSSEAGRVQSGTFVRLMALAFNLVTLVVSLLYGPWSFVLVGIFYGLVLALVLAGPGSPSGMPAPGAPGEISIAAPR